METVHSTIETIAREKLGFEHLRPGQKEAIQSITGGRDTLVVQPTGSGKSAIYQIAGLLMEGCTVIVSPLIALQKDQVDSIQFHDAKSTSAAAVNSKQRASELEQSRREIERGDIEYIFLAPEQLRKPETIDLLRHAGISLFVVDEAHCISEWGHDFRPDYLRLGGVIEALGRPRVLALTATASPVVRQEIIERLQMKHPKVLVRDFDRPNIYLRVDHFETKEEKRDELIHRVAWAGKPGIVYVGTRKAAEEITQALAAENIRSLFYHGGLPGKARDRIQEQFMSGDADVIVATNAFGMGIDKPDIRFVYHYDVPESMDSYYQEIGRAGRDGLRAEAVLFYRDADIGAQSFKTGEARIDTATLEKIAARIASEAHPVLPSTLADETGLSKRKLTTALQRLEDVGVTEWMSDGEVRIAEGAYPDEADYLRDAARLATLEQERRREAAHERLEQMRTYAEATTCRRETLLRYLGDDFTGPCKFCDICDASSERLRLDPSVGTRREVT